MLLNKYRSLYCISLRTAIVYEECLHLRFRRVNSLITYYSLPGHHWRKLSGNSKGTFSSLEDANHYLKTLIGTRATSEGDSTDSHDDISHAAGKFITK